MAGPNPYHSPKNVASVAGQSDRALVVNIQDPLKAGRVQIRIVGKMDDQQAIPDEKLPWVKVMNGTGTSSLQTSTTTHGLLPGSMVVVEGYGEGGQDYMVKHTIPSDNKGANQTIHPSTQGDNSDKVLPRTEYDNKTHGWGKNFDAVVDNKTTKGAVTLRDSIDRNKQRSAEPCEESRDKCGIPKHYGERKTTKDGGKGSGTIGTFKFSGKDAQKFIQDKIQNKSAVVPNALSALQSLKKVTGNPTSINSIGASNFSSIMSQLSSWFKSNGSKEEQQKFDCDYLIKLAENLLTTELREARDLCLLAQQLERETTS